MKKTCLLFILLMLIMPQFLVAQGTDASIQGNVLGEDGKALPGATVMVENTSTGFETGTITNIAGRFSIKELPLGGPYSVSVSYVGFDEVKKTGYYLNQGSNFNLNFKMDENVQELNELVVSGQGFRSRDKRLSAATAITAKDVQNLATNDRNFNNLAALSPLVGNGTNIGGFDNSFNSIQIDGVNAREASFGGSGSSPYVFSMEALREFEVVTNSYDVVDGRGAMGSIKAVSKSGTNEFTGSVFSYFWDARLAHDQDLRGRDVLGDTKVQRGFSLGGPLIKDKLHFFVTYDGERFDEQYDLWAQSDEEGILQNNRGGRISVSDMDEIISILREPRYGVDQGQQYGFFQRTRKLDTWFARLDWTINQKHKLTFRYTSNDFERPNRNNSDIGRYGIHAASYDFINRGDNLLLSLRSQLNPSLSNDFKLGYFYNTRGNIITTGRHPQLWIQSTSMLPNGEEAEYTLVGRYNRWTPEDQTNYTYNMVNNLYLTKGKFFFTFGTDNLLTNSEGIYTHDTQGLFEFNSIEALRNGDPDRYVRKFTNPGQELIDPLNVWMLDASAYAQVETEVIPNLEVSAGLRYDVSIFMDAADYNQVLDEELGHRNDVKPRDLNNIQPRLNLNWDVNGDGRNIINAGAGWFTGQVVTRPYIYSLIDNGIRFTLVDVRKGQTDEFGNEIQLPTPDYAEYDENYDAIPGEGLTVNDLYPSLGSASQVVRFVDDDFQVPMSFRANLSYHRYLTDWLRVGASLYYSKTNDLYVMENANLPSQPAFTLNGEGGRVVYTPLDQYSTESRGELNADNARISNQFAQALSYTNGYESSFRALVLDAAFSLPKGGKANISYTRAEARGAERFRNEDDQRFVGTSYFDYGFINNGFSPNDFRHKFLVNITSPKMGGTTIGLFANVVQRGRFSATIRRFDVSGTNIRSQTGYTAYIYDPYDPQTAEIQGEQFAEDLRYVFENASPEAQEFLRESVGSYATPNGGMRPWRTDLNIRVNQELPIFKNHKLLLNLDCFNVLNLINSDWGGFHNIINQELYNVEGFDPATRTLQYSVRRNYGQRRYEGDGFTIMLGAKYMF